MAGPGISMVLERLVPMMEEMVKLHCLNIEREVEKLSTKLNTIQTLLGDAEEKGLTDPKVRSWLSKLQDIVYDIDDMLDEWSHNHLQETDDSSHRHQPEKVTSFFQSSCLCFNRVDHKHPSTALTVKELNGRLDSVAEENEKEFKFVPDLTHVTHEFKRIEPTFQNDLSEVKGREKELQALENMLLGDSDTSGYWEDTENGAQVFSIVGSGGMGKTTLAQLAFQNVKSRFDERAWICVSDPFDEIKIAKAILEALNMSSSDLTELDPLLTTIESATEDNKFLIVLDDVWLENEERWIPFWNSLKNNGAPGSKILVTTRSTKVANAMGSFDRDILELGPLSDSDCWSILSQLAFRERNYTDIRVFERTGQLIAEKCEGSPLAAKIIGSHLSSTSSLEEWENVLNDEVWELEKASTDLFPILRLSYSKLDPASKRCFSYCAMFPKDSVIPVDLVKVLWMAQGFVPGRSASEVAINAQKIFDDLAARSFFQDFERKGISGAISTFKIHEIVRDFALFITEKKCLTIVLDDENTSDEQYSCQNARHVLIKSLKSTPVSVNHAENVHTFLLEGTKPPENLFNLLERARALLLSDCGVIPEEVGRMIHLRLLSLSSSEMVELPGSICNLFELQTLFINSCMNLGRFPHGIHRLQNLRHLMIHEHMELPQGFEKLINLQTLVTFGADKKNKLGYLKDMEQLRLLGIKIKDLNTADDLREVERADLKNKNLLEHLNLKIDYADEGITMDVVEALQPPTCLQDLGLVSFLKIPDWMPTLTNLRELLLVDLITVDWSHLAKLPALEKLTINYIQELEIIGHDFLGIYNRSPDRAEPIFPRLKELKFSYCSEWEVWEDITEEEEENNDMSLFPCLQSLYIYYCEVLQMLPHSLLRKATCLNTLYIEDCRYLHSIYNQDDGQLWDSISHISNVQIL